MRLINFEIQDLVSSLFKITTVKLHLHEILGSKNCPSALCIAFFLRTHKPWTMLAN